MDATQETKDVAKLEKAAEKVEKVFPGSTKAATVRTKRNPKPCKFGVVKQSERHAKAVKDIMSKVEAAKAVKAAAEAGKKISADVAAVVDLRKVPAAARRAPQSGQSGESRAAELTYDALSADHKRILTKLNGNGKGDRDDFGYDVLEIGGKTEETKSGARVSRLRVRNALRILVRDGWVEKRGTRGEPAVRISNAGRARMAKAGA